MHKTLKMYKNTLKIHPKSIKNCLEIQNTSRFFLQRDTQAQYFMPCTQYTILRRGGTLVD